MERPAITTDVLERMVPLYINKIIIVIILAGYCIVLKADIPNSCDYADAS
jgi:hypothetical protein